jgi:enamine deaminase RidA (YjgF/YER057c/UK114 family)
MPKLSVRALLLAATAAGCAAHPPTPARDRTDVEYFPVPGRTDLPFSKVVRVGDMLYLSGELGMDSTGKLVPGGIQTETRQALENIRQTLIRHGSGLERVVKCTAMLANMSEWGP